MKITTALLAALASVPAALGADVDEWKSRNIYFALTDRFATGEDGGEACGDLASYCGGTFKGLTSKLDYIQGMGFDAIWITPVVANVEGGYHGYWAKDLEGINENYGTPEDLKEFVAAAHKLDMYVMLDVVANHMGDAPFSELGPEPLNSEAAYHEECEIDYEDQTSVEQCWIAGLPDIKTEDPDVRAYLTEWIGWIIGEYEFDGVRIDTVKHVEQDFWADFSKAAGVYTVGEVWDPDLDYLVGYAEVMDGLLDYGIFYQMNEFYQGTGTAQALADAMDQVSAKFPDPAALGTFLDNHDNPRWLSEKDDTTLLQNALAYVILSRGIPIVYYGTEQGYSGGEDPKNREDLWSSGYDTDAPLYKAIAAMSKARKDAGGLAADDHKHLLIDDSVYAWSRADGDLVVVTTNAGPDGGGEQCVEGGKPDTEYADAMGGEAVTADAEGNLCVTFNEGLPVILVAGGAGGGDGGDEPSASGDAGGDDPSATDDGGSDEPAESEAPAETEEGSSDEGSSDEGSSDDSAGSEEGSSDDAGGE